MKIIHVLSGLTKGGGERMVMELANQAIANGDEVTLLVGWPEDPALLQDKFDPSIEIKFIGANRKSAYLKIIGWILRNSKWLRSKDVLHCHLTYGLIFGTIANILLRKIRRYSSPLIVETNHAVGMPISKSLKWLQTRMAFHRDGVVLMAHDPYWDAFMLKHTNVNHRIIPNGIAPLKYSEDNIAGNQYIKKLCIDNARYVVGSISMLRADRSPASYVPVFDEIYKVLGEDTHFILGGSGDEQEKIETLINELGLKNNFHLVGLVNDPAQLIMAVDVYVSVSVGSTGGISMIEAAMCGKPVVSVQLTEGYKAKEEDWVWSSSDAAELGARIVALLKNDAERKQLALSQQNYVNSHFTSLAMYTAYNEFYNQLLAKRKK